MSTSGDSVFKFLIGVTFISFSACSITPYKGSYLDLSQHLFADTKEIPIALIEPILAIQSCKANRILVSLPDEVACENGSSWVFQPSLLILPPADMLLLSLRFAGLSVSTYPSLAAARQAGARVAILSVVTQAEAIVWNPREFYVEQTSFFQRMKDGHLMSGDPTDGTRTRVVAGVKLRISITDIHTGQILWRGPMEQHMENVVPIPPLAGSRLRVESEAGRGEFEPKAYAMRSLVVQAYAQLGQSLARQIREAMVKRTLQ